MSYNPLKRDAKQWEIEDTINRLMRGYTNTVGTCTLTPSTVSTVVSDLNVHSASHVALTPLSANAAAALTGLYVSSRTTGSFTLTHASNAQTDKIFSYEVKG